MKTCKRLKDTKGTIIIIRIIKPTITKITIIIPREN